VVVADQNLQPSLRSCERAREPKSDGPGSPDRNLHGWFLLSNCGLGMNGAIDQATIERLVLHGFA
jgi:hypothetical protein